MLFGGGKETSTYLLLHLGKCFRKGEAQLERILKNKHEFSGSDCDNWLESWKVWEPKKWVDSDIAVSGLG